MSIKDLFNRSSQVIASSSIEKVSEDVESPEYIAEYNEDVVRVEPHIDFSDPANFSKYGSAEEYYLRSLEYIYDEYPYDGSLKERLEWKKQATLLDLYILDNKYPKSTDTDSQQAVTTSTLTLKVDQIRLLALLSVLPRCQMYLIPSQTFLMKRSQVQADQFPHKGLQIFKPT
jgi:hypothetical protein